MSRPDDASPGRGPRGERTSVAHQAQSLPGTHEAGHEHPTERTYIQIAGILTILTVIEVAIYYIDQEAAWLVPALLVLASVKFLIVIGFYMHLKFDDSRLAQIFSFGLGVSLAIYIGMYALMHFHRALELTALMTSATR